MRYDISKPSVPKMPNLGRRTECIKILLSQASKDIQDPLVPMFFPVLGANISGVEFQYPDNILKEMTGMMANLVAKSGDNKGQFTPCDSPRLSDDSPSLSCDKAGLFYLNNLEAMIIFIIFAALNQLFT